MDGVSDRTGDLATWDLAASGPATPPKAPNDRPLTLALLLGIGWAFSLATQYVAWRFRYDPRLGASVWSLPRDRRAWVATAAVLLVACAGAATIPRRTRWLALPVALGAVTTWIVATGPLYPPYGIVLWYTRYQELPGVPAAFRPAWIILALGVLASTLATLGVRRRGRSRSTSIAHGSAGWGDGADLHAQDGFALGRDASGRILRYGGDGHLITIAPTRSGKGVSCVIPNLLSYPGSALVTDVKSGELYAVTARHRETLTPALYALDPFGTVRLQRPDHRGAFNPLDLIDPAADDAIDDARLLAEMLVVPDGKPSESSFWVEEARGLLTGLILHVASEPHRDNRTLLEVRRLLTLPPQGFADLLKGMLARPFDVHGLVARSAARLLQKADKERSGVISTAQSQTHFLDSPRMEAVLKHSTFHFTALKQQLTTVYVILPSDRVASYAAYVRLMIGCGLLGLYRVDGRPRRRVLFLLDEFGDLGNLVAIERAIRLAASAGGAFWLLLQDLSRLRATYGESAGSFLAGTAVKQVFGTNDLATAEHISGLLGQATVPVASENQSAGVSHGRHAQRQHGTGVTASVVGRKLLLPDEVMRLPAERALLCIAGARPLCVERLSYLEDPEWRGTFDPNPLYGIVTPMQAGARHVPPPDRSASEGTASPSVTRWARRRRRMRGDSPG